MQPLQPLEGIPCNVLFLALTLEVPHTSNRLTAAVIRQGEDVPPILECRVCMSCFLQSLGCKKRRVDGSLDNSNLEPLEILWLFFPLLILNVQQHVVQRLGQRNPRHRLAASLLQSCNLGTDPPRRFVLQNVNVAKLLPILQFFAFFETLLLNLSACFCAMLTIQNVKGAITILPRRYAQRSSWWQCLVSCHFSGNVVIVDGSDLSALLGLVNFQISNLYLHGFTILLPQPLCHFDCELHLRYCFLLTLLLASFLRRVPVVGPW
mmetsp:Transcript_65531/g.109099  ORF Transcript_65531/g.109099 Transcript_65531/m.109099 type:complete len:264 (-) Transcript_65531:97-888(-)